MAYIIIEKGNKSDIGKRISFDENAVIIGRNSGDDNPEIPIDNEYVSRRHAEISFNDGKYKIRDLNSTNGTSLHGQIIEPETFYSLIDNTVIGLGISSGIVQVELRFRSSSSVPTTRLTSVNISELTTVNWLRIDEKLGEVWINEKQIILSKKEYAFMIYLYRKAGKVCTREELIAEVWPEVVDMTGVSDASLDQLVHRLRLKIEDDPSNPTRIINRKGFGFMLV